MQVSAVVGVDKSFVANAKALIWITMIERTYEILHRCEAPWWLKIYLFFCLLFGAGVVIRDPIADEGSSRAYKRIKPFKDVAYVLSEWGGKYEE